MHAAHSATARAFAWGRVVMMALIVGGLTLTLMDTSGLVPDNYLHLVTYYTLQSNVVALGVWGVATAVTLGRVSQPRWLEAGRALVAANLLIVAIIYWVQVAPLGLEHGWKLQVVMVISHVITPVFGAVDQVLVGRSDAVSWDALPWLAAHPLAWSVSAVINAWMGGWVPYEYLDPSRGIDAVVSTVVVQGTVLLGLTVAAMRWRRWRVVASPDYSASFGMSPMSTDPERSDASQRDFSRASSTLMTPQSPKSSM